MSVMRPTGKPPSKSSSSRQPKEHLSASDMVLARTGLMRLMVNCDPSLTCNAAVKCLWLGLRVHPACTDGNGAGSGLSGSHISLPAAETVSVCSSSCSFCGVGTPLLPGNAGRQPSAQHNEALEPGLGLRPSSWAIGIKDSIAQEGPFLLRLVAYSTIGAATIK